MKKVLIMAGGTGGHIFPALAVAEALKQKGIQVCWLGRPEGLEAKLVPSEYTMMTLHVKSLRGKGLLRKILAPCLAFKATILAYRIMKKVKPDLVLGMGGYVSGPGGLAAWLARVPLVIHEQNAVAGLTNRCLARLSTAVLKAYDQALPNCPSAKTVGNPVRSALLGMEPPAARLSSPESPLRVLVLGGSQGAQVINRCVIGALLTCDSPHAFSVWHQSGLQDFQWLSERYQSMGVKARVDTFIDSVENAYAWADLVVCRAGALTVSEVMAVGVASIFIPFPYAVDDHQWHNSYFLEEAGAARVIRQELLNKVELLTLLNQFSADRETLLSMAEKARSLAKKNATQDVVAVCEKLMAASTNKK